MAANPAVFHDSAASAVIEMSERIEALAAAAEWDQIEDITVRLQAAVTKVPEAERRAVLLAVQCSIDNVANAARLARQSVSGKLTELRRGQVAKKAYELR
jgi:5-methylthioribose kinase